LGLPRQDFRSRFSIWLKMIGSAFAGRSCFGGPVGGLDSPRPDLPTTSLDLNVPNWLLPESIADVLPSEARIIEDLRRRLLDCYQSYGYELVQPPLIEYLDALLTGSGQDLSLKTFKLVDQLSGHTLGIRADITPQVARIDAHLLNRRGLSRLCYSGSVLHTLPAGLYASREPLQIGAELYGHEGIEADLEIIELMLRSLHLSGAKSLRLDVNHSAIIPSLLKGLDGIDPEEVYRLVGQRDVPSLRSLLAKAPEPQKSALIAIAASEADESLSQLRQRLPGHSEIERCLSQFEALRASSLWRHLPHTSLALDLADVRGYRYHNGLVFSAYVLDSDHPRVRSQAMARGGRYDGAGDAFGRFRPATGFSLELRDLASLNPKAQASLRGNAIRAPWADDEGLRQSIAKLRAQGEIVVQVLPGHEDEQQEFAYDRQLLAQNGIWLLRAL
jgi:ATP phosphoribosyltransferase regulatory subunit